MPLLKRAIDSLIYLSVALGLVLLPQLYGLVPSWLFYSVLGGWLAYVAVAILVATGRAVAYPLVCSIHPHACRLVASAGALLICTGRSFSRFHHIPNWFNTPSRIGIPHTRLFLVETEATHVGLTL